MPIAARELQYRRTHNLLLMQKLLSGRENASPFTLVLDSLEQSGRPLVRYMIKKASAANVHIIFVSFETLRKPRNIGTFIRAHNLKPEDLQKKLASLISKTQRSLVILDTVHPLLSSSTIHITTFLLSLTSPQTSLLATYHLDISLPTSTPQTYTPPPLTTLKYLATTIFTAHCLHHVLAQKAARDRAEAEPLFGLGGGHGYGEGLAGVTVGLGSNDKRGIVVELEYRRRSGRGVVDWFFLPSCINSHPSPGAVPKLSSKSKEAVILLEDHPLYRTSTLDAMKESEADPESTFSLGLTEKQRRDRAGVVLPYFDAQGEGGAGEGGRILYEMGVEDDFDEEEDEI